MTVLFPQPCLLFPLLLHGRGLRIRQVKILIRGGRALTPKMFLVHWATVILSPAPEADLEIDARKN